MGFKSYFIPTKQHDPETSSKKGSQNSQDLVLSPKTPKSFLSGSQTPTSQSTSLRSSELDGVYPHGDFRNAKLSEINDVKCDVMVNWLHQQQRERLWTALGDDEGVVLKKSRGRYACCPANLADTPGGFMSAIELLNVRVAITMNTKVIKLFLHSTKTKFVPLSDGLRLQVLEDISHLPKCQKHQFAAFIENRGELIVWDDDPRHVLDRASRIETELLEMIWNAEGTGGGGITEEKNFAPGKYSDDSGSVDLEDALDEDKRPVVLWNAVLSALTIILTIACISAGYRKVAIEIAIDQNYLRLAFLASLPAQLWLGLFFFQSLASNGMQMLGPISQMNQNSKYYSGLPPKRISQACQDLPHVTIQMPVFKEGLSAVIEPTIFSVKAAISTYEMQGGSANIFVNDDGMQLLDDERAKARQEFYDEHNIGWVARPKHNPKPAEGEEVFLRRGKFKKASNMNYGLWVSARVEDKLQSVERDEEWSTDDETRVYKEALDEIVSEDGGKTWADGNIRVGDYILLIDSDTRVPNDCFLNAVSEMERSQQVAVLQYSSGVMNVTNSFFENGITFFTHLIYTAIRYAVANGDVAPFVGHNAFLRWSALQSISYECADDHREKFWSESTVSEDFDMALRLQTIGYTTRLAAYTGDGFKEGVSLTVYDELARWEKYAYGCSELVFHPLRYWPTHSPFTPLFRRFITSSMPLPSKLTIMAYVGTYYALASAWILTLANYFLIGWFLGYLDRYYLDSFKIYVGIVLVFSALGNLALAVLRYRAEAAPLLPSLLENYRWMPLLTLFLSGISLHVSQAILAHLCGVEMSWGATAKEVEHTTFFREIPKVLRKFKVTFTACACLAGMMVVMASGLAPPFWRIKEFIAVYPLGLLVVGHVLVPIALNPNLMLFTW